MLKRIYIDNYKSLVNFELKLDSINLFLGRNGSGKSTIFEVLRKIQEFICQNEKVDIFETENLTRWQKSNIQIFELELEENGGLYKYELTVEHEPIRHLVRVIHEGLFLDQKPLLKFDKGEAQLYHDDHTEGPEYPFDWTQSAVATLPSRPDNKKLTRFKKMLENFIIVQINPTLIPDESYEIELSLDAEAENFVSWYRNISEDQGKIIDITNSLKEIIDGFESFNFAKVGEQHRLLKVRFKKENDKPIEYRFNELSEGERVLFILYTILNYAKSENCILCLDEPENFLALPEIQPWLMQLDDLCRDNQLQALIISHHPEFINYLAAYAGFWFEREPNSPVRIKEIPEHDEKGLPISELITRGWLYE